ncbi:MAG: preprotein translocase subunit SecE [Steroidobacteraceae bacterium]
MNEEVRNATAGGADKVKLAAAIAVVFAGLGAFYGLGQLSVAVRWLLVLAALVLALAVVALSTYGRAFWQFVLDSRIELRKIVWPNRQETGMTTLVVLVFVVVSGAFFWLLDLMLSWATRALSGHGG